MLKEALRLYRLGLAVHWIKPKSKAPVKSKWTGNTRDDWKTLKADYRDGMGLGVRLGQPSRLSDGTYLAVIDIDLRGEDPRYRQEALATIKRKFPGLMLQKTTPKVATGRGNGSGHIYVRTKTPVQSGKLGSSNEEAEVYSPTSPVSKRQAELLSPEKLAKGIRLKAAWEVDLMSIGRQVVLPPTLHPDTGKPYRWTTPLTDIAALPLVDTDGIFGNSTVQSTGVSDSDRFEPEDVDLIASSLSDRIVDMLVRGTGVTDRSAAVFSVSLAMVKAGFTDNQIMSALTDRGNYLSEAAYEHRKTSNRASAAAWIRDYSIKKARAEIAAHRAFDDNVEVLPPLPDDVAKAQAKDLTGFDEDDWQARLDRTKGVGGMPGPIKATLKNIVAIIQNTVARDVFKRDTFADRDFYGCKTPWGGKKGKALKDDDAVKIKMWLARTWHIEPTVNTVHEAISFILTENQFHPVRDYLAALPPWDGVNRLDTWLKDFIGAKAPEPYLSEVSRKFLLAAITRVMEPGCKFDHMAILQGKQGVGKSSIGQILAGDRWFLDGLPDLGDKDAALGLRGCWFVEMGELASLRRTEIETVKAFITRRVDKVRPPYGRLVVEHQRQCVFFGTTNADYYLIDKTGNRRFWPVEVTRKLNFEGFGKAREQLFAEALWCYHNLPEPLYLSKEATAQLEDVHSDKMAEDTQDTMTNDLRTSMAAENGFAAKRFRMESLFSGIDAPLGNYRQDVQNMRHAASALRHLGFERKRFNDGYWWASKDLWHKSKHITKM